MTHKHRGGVLGAQVMSAGKYHFTVQLENVAQNTLIGVAYTDVRTCSICLWQCVVCSRVLQSLLCCSPRCIAVTADLMCNWKFSKHPHWCRTHQHENMFYMSDALCCSEWCVAVNGVLQYRVTV